MARLDNKVAIITGGGSGQGRAACTIFAREGARVAVVDLNGEGAEETTRLVTAAGGSAIAIQADVSLAADVRALVQRVMDEYGRVDVLHNNAGIGFSSTRRYTMADIVETPEDAWDAIQRINLKSVYLCCQAVIPIMVAQGGGSIINVASINAMVGVAGADAYTASKGGVLALTRVIATEWGKRGIRCNCVCPGPIDTPMVAEVLDRQGVRSYWEDQLPIGRIGRSEDPAYAALYFASDESSFVTGQVLAVDGGWTAR